MDCNYTNQKRACLGCPRFYAQAVEQAVDENMTITPASGNNLPKSQMSGCSCGCGCGQGQKYCPNTSVGGMEQYPIAMAYVPWQQWKQTYPLEQGFSRGTIFPELDLPFMMGRCR